VALALLVLLAASIATAAEPFVFEEAAAKNGLKFVLENHPTPQKHMVETMAGGLAVFDYDGDGAPDVFFANGAALPSLKKSGPSDWNRLFRNRGDGTFEDVTRKAGVAGGGYAMGASAADYDNDGHADLFVPGVFGNQLLRNQGDGKFQDAIAKSGIQSDRWSVAAGWFDYDNDGYLDLFVVNYADWTPAYDRFCGDRNRNVRVYCHPKYFKPIANQLYRNRGDGTFEDVTKASGIGAHAGRGMSVAFADFDADGDQDAFVTNDNLPNSLFLNQGDGTFLEDALLAGAALLSHGKPVASMGADATDFDNDGRPDLTVTALAGESFPVFRNEGDGLFLDVTNSSGAAKAVARYAGWGLGFGDFDRDGWKDLFTANSHVNDLVEQFEPYEYEQENLILRNVGGKFVASLALPGKKAHRGAGIADFDGDGRLDVVTSSLGGAAELWLNRTSGGAWIAFDLQGTKSNRDGIGVCIELAGQTNCMASAVGYASSRLTPVFFGLKDAKVAKATVRWPSGTVQTIDTPAAGKVHRIVEPD